MHVVDVGSRQGHGCSRFMSCRKKLANELRVWHPEHHVVARQLVAKVLDLVMCCFLSWGQLDSLRKVNMHASDETAHCLNEVHKGRRVRHQFAQSISLLLEGQDSLFLRGVFRCRQAHLRLLVHFVGQSRRVYKVLLKGRVFEVKEVEQSLHSVSSNQISLRLDSQPTELADKLQELGLVGSEVL